jgi:hypothetical protein
MPSSPSPPDVPGRVTLEPAEFQLVDFDPDALRALVERLLDDVGLDQPVTLEVDQTTPLGHTAVRSTDPIVLFAESGALEDPRHLRALGPGAAIELGRMLFRVRDRLDPAFGEVPPDGEVSLQEEAAWDAYAVGRLIRAGHTHYDERQRRLYQFRTRHGFSDAGDASFAALWDGDGLTWADIQALSAQGNSRVAAR